MEHSIAPEELGRAGRSDPFSRKGRGGSRRWDHLVSLEEALLEPAASSHPGVRPPLLGAPPLCSPGCPALQQSSSFWPHAGGGGELTKSCLSGRLAGRQARGRPASPAGRPQPGRSALPPRPSPPAPAQRLLTTLHFEVRVVPLSPETPRALQAPRVKCSLAQFPWPYFYLCTHDPPLVDPPSLGVGPPGAARTHHRISTSLSTCPRGLLATQTLLLQPDFRAAGGAGTTRFTRDPCARPERPGMAFTRQGLYKRLNEFPGFVSMTQPLGLCSGSLLSLQSIKPEAGREAGVGGMDPGFSLIHPR